MIASASDLCPRCESRLTGQPPYCHNCRWQAGLGPPRLVHLSDWETETHPQCEPWDIGVPVTWRWSEVSCPACREIVRECLEDLKVDGDPDAVEQIAETLAGWQELDGQS